MNYDNRPPQEVKDEFKRIFGVDLEPEFFDQKEGFKALNMIGWLSQHKKDNESTFDVIGRLYGEEGQQLVERIIFQNW